MEDLASLGLSIRSDGVAVATDRLDDFEKQSEKTNRTADRLKKTLKRLAVVVGASLAAAFSVRTLFEYQNALAEVSTLVDTATFSMKDLSAAALEQASTFGDVQGQVKAYYQIISAGAGSVAEATDILTASNKLAVGGVTDIATAADGLTSVLNAYGDKVEGANDVSDALFVAMRAGKTTIGELSSGLGKVAPLAAQTGVDFDELAGAVSALTKGGISTQEAITGVRAVLAAVAKPTSEAAKLANQLGLEFNSSALASKGLTGFLDDLVAKTGGSTDVLAQLFGGVEALVPVMALSGQAGKDYAAIMTDMVEKAGATEEAFNKMAASPGFQAGRVWASLQVEAIKAGSVLGDILVPAMKFLADNMSIIFRLAGVVSVGLAAAFAPTILAAMAAGLTTIGIAGVAALNAIRIAVMANPLGAIMVAIITLVTALYTFRDEIKDILGVDVVAIAKDTANALIGLFGGAYRAIVVGWGLLPAAFADIFTRAMNGSIDIVQNGVNAIVGALKNVPGLGDMQDVDLSQFKGQETGASGELGTAVSTAFNQAMGVDYVGMLGEGLAQITGTAAEATEALTQLEEVIGTGGDDGTGTGINGAIQAANDNIYEMSDALAALGPATIDPLTQLQTQLSDLDDLLQKNKISWEQYGEAAYRANMSATSSVLGLASGMTGALSQMFKDNKAFAIANAVVNTAEAVTKALATYGPTPWGFAAAGVAAASGAAQIAAIASANKGGGSVASVGGSAQSAPQQAAPAPSQSTTNVTLVGNGFSGEQIAELLEEYLNDGGNLNVTTAA